MATLFLLFSVLNSGNLLPAAETYPTKPINFIVPNEAGAYTIGMSHATILINKLLGNLPYDHTGFTVLGTYATFIPIIVSSTRTQRPFKTLQEVISFAKANPGEVSIATSGIGQSWWVATLAFQEGTKLQFNIIPQPGTGAFAAAKLPAGILKEK